MYIEIKKRKIGPGFKPYIIAEACINHDGVFAIAEKMILEAKRAGACAIKFQMHHLDDEMLKETPKSANFSESLYETLNKTNFTIKQHKELKAICKKNSIDYLCTPFSRMSVDVLCNQLKVDVLKVGSGELTNLPLQTHIAKKKLPTIISTGMSNLSEIKYTIERVKKINKKICLMQCTSVYPCPYELSDINVIPVMMQKFNLPVGLSDHTNTIFTSLGAIALGACIIEKHFTLDKKSKGPDHASSIEPDELSELVEGSKAIFKARGNKKRIHKEEMQIIKWARESVVSIKDINKNQFFTKENISVKRPAAIASEIPAKYYEKVIGKYAKRNIKKNRKIKWQEIKQKK